MADALREVKPVKLSPKDRDLVMRKIIEACRREGYVVVKHDKAKVFLGTWLFSNFIDKGSSITRAMCNAAASDVLKKMGVI